MDNQKLQQAFYRAQEVGDMQAAKYFAEQIMRQAGSPPTPPNKFEDVNRRARVGRGMMDVAQGAKQFGLNITGSEKAPEYNRQVDQEIRQYEQDAGPGFDGYRVLGQAAAVSPLGLPKLKETLLGRIGQGAWQGGVAGGVLATKDNESRATNAVVGGVAGGVANPVAPYVGAAAIRGVDKATRAAKTPFAGMTASREVNALTDQYGISQEMRDNLRAAAMRQMKETGQVDHDALQRMARFSQYGFEGDAAPMSGQITRDPRQWTRERNLQKLDGVGDEITGRLRNQNMRFMDIMDDLGRKTGRSVDDVVDSGESIIGAVNNRHRATQDAIRQLYKEARDTHGNVEGILPDRLTLRLDDLRDNATADQISDSVARRLARYGLYDENGQPTGKTLTVSQAEDFRRFINGLSDGNDLTLQMYKRQLVDELDDDVFTAIGDDAFREARAAARSRFTEFEQNIVEKIVKGKLGEDKAVNAIVYRHSPKELEQLKATLMQAEGGDAAWNNLRGEVVEMLSDKATQGQGRDGAFSGAAFRKELDRFGRKKIEVLFPDEADYLYGLARVGMDMTYQPPYAAVNNSNTAATLGNYLSMSGAEGAIMRRFGNMLSSGGDVERALSGYPVNRTAQRANLQQWGQLIGNQPPIEQLRRQIAPAAALGGGGLLSN